MELVISSTQSIPSAEALRDYQKRVARHVYRTGLEFHTIKIDSYKEILGITPRYPGYKLPSFDDLNGWLLQEIQNEIKAYVEEIKESWKSTGCSILLDGWKVGNRNLINILVGCPKGTIYLRSADISESDALKVLLDEVLVDVGVENVVQIMSHSTSPLMQEIGKNLVDEYPSIFWTVSGSCCVELMLRKLSSMDRVRKVIKESESISRYIHGNLSVMKLLRNRASIPGLIKRSTISIVTPFLTLQNMVIESAALKKFFRSSAWKSSRWANTEVGKMTAQLVMDNDFWEGANLVVKAIMPLVNVLEWMKRDNDHLGNIYETIDQVKETIREEMKDETFGHTPFWEAIDDIWNEYLHSPIHAMGYFLNPYLFYADDFSSHPEVTTGVLCCSARMIEDLGALHKFSKQLDEYQRASGAFGVGKANLSYTTPTSPVDWWLEYGDEYPELQRIAIRILSQTCNGASKYHLNRSMAKRMLSGVPSEDEEQTLINMAFVHYNLHLQRIKSTGTNEIETPEMEGTDAWPLDSTQQATSSSNALTSMDMD